MKKGRWTFLTNHGRVLAYLAKNQNSTIEEIAKQAGITLRTVQHIIDDLETSGYIARYKEGRNNRYIIHPEQPMRHRLERDHSIGDILNALANKPSAKNLSEDLTN